MAGTRPLSSDPLRNFKYNVVIPRVGPAGQQMSRYGFMTVSGLGIQIEPLTYREGGDNLTTRKSPGQADVNPLTLSRGLFATDSDNWDWMTIMFTAMYGGSEFPPSSDFRTVAYINLLEHPNNTSQAAVNPYGVTYPQQNNIVKVSWKLFSAWIGSLAYSDFDAGGNAVAIDQVTLNYEGFDMQWGGDYASGYVPNPVGW